MVQPLLKRLKADVRFHLETWPKSEPRRFDENETIDDEFVSLAVASDLLLTLIVEQLGSGTRKEIEAVVASGTEIAVLWFVGHEERVESPAAKFLEQLQSDGVLRYRKAGRLETNEGWEAIVTVLLDAVMAALSPEDREAFHERR